MGYSDKVLPCTINNYQYDEYFSMLHIFIDVHNICISLLYCFTISPNLHIILLLIIQVKYLNWFISTKKRGDIHRILRRIILVLLRPPFSFLEFLRLTQGHLPGKTCPPGLFLEALSPYGYFKRYVGVPYDYFGRIEISY